MITFNLSFVQNWKEKGYNHILIVPREKYGVLRPLTYDKAVQKGYTIEIDELRFIHMEENYFIVKQKDATVLKGISHAGNFAKAS